MVLASAEILPALKDLPEVDIQASSRVQHHWQSLAVAVVHHLDMTVRVLLEAAVAQTKAELQLVDLQKVAVQEQLLQAVQKLLVVQLMARNTQVEMVVVVVLKVAVVVVRVITAAAVEEEAT